MTFRAHAPPDAMLGVQVEYPILDQFSKLSSLLSCGGSRGRKGEDSDVGAVGEAAKGDNLA